MAFLLGVDTGGTYTDAVVLDDAKDEVVSSAKALTSRPDLSTGITEAIDAAIAFAKLSPAAIAMVSLSTTLATNALVEGQGGRVALVLVGFDEAELGRAGLSDALRGDPVIIVEGGHDHAGAEAKTIDMEGLKDGLASLDDGISAFAVAASFATRNPAHELAVRDVIRAKTGKPVSCSHELSAGLGGPKRALTAVLNARLIGMIDKLISATEAHLRAIGIQAGLMVVRGDGALVSAAIAREKPIETILSGPAASVAGAQWLSGETNALVSDIGGTTTDICMLRDGHPSIDPQGARVGPFRTMVEAVAMRTWGLGGDSEVHVKDGLMAGLILGPRRLMPLSLAAHLYPAVIHNGLDKALAQDLPASDGGQFVIPLWTTAPTALDQRETAIIERLSEGPLRLGSAVQTRMENAAIARLVTRGVVMLSGVTPSDAAHVLGTLDSWDADAARKAVTLFARRRTGAGVKVAPGPSGLAQMIIDQLAAQTVNCLLEAAFAEDTHDWHDVQRLVQHPLTQAGLDGHNGAIKMDLALGVPVIGLGASAGTYYGAVGQRLKTRMVLPEYAHVANAIGAVVGQVQVQADGTVTGTRDGVYVLHLPNGPQHFGARDTALAALEDALSSEVHRLAAQSGIEGLRLSKDIDINEVDVEGQTMFIEATMRVIARGRPRIAVA